MKRTSTINRVRALERTTTLQRAGALNGIVVLRAVVLCIGTGDRSVVVGIGALQWAAVLLIGIQLRAVAQGARALLLWAIALRVSTLKRAIAILRTIVLRIGALERPHGALRLLRVLIAVLLLTGHLRERSPAAEQHKDGHDTLRF